MEPVAEIIEDFAVTGYAWASALGLPASVLVLGLGAGAWLVRLRGGVKSRDRRHLRG